MKTLQECTLGEIATRIFTEQESQGKRVSRAYPAAFPYLDAMLDLNTLQDRYGADSAQNIVLYFLNNAAQFRGPVIKEAKAELKARLRANGYKI
jgi:hypothetical protein